MVALGIISEVRCRVIANIARQHVGLAKVTSKEIAEPLDLPLLSNVAQNARVCDRIPINVVDYKLGDRHRERRSTAATDLHRTGMAHPQVESELVKVPHNSARAGEVEVAAKLIGSDDVLSKQNLVLAKVVDGVRGVAGSAHDHA